VADLGFIAICPDLFWRIEPGVDITDKSEAEWQKAFELFNKFDQVKGIEDLKATVAAARKLPGANGKVATMGYCLGGRLAFMMAEQSDADANISYYGVGLDNLLGDLGKVTKPLVVHIADNDEFFPAEGRAKVVEAVKGQSRIACHVYPNADHAFARVGGVHWQGRAAAIANHEGGWLADRPEHGHRVAALLADLEVLGGVPRAAGIGAAVVGDDLIGIREELRNSCIQPPITARRWDQQQRRSLAAHFVVQVIPFRRHAARLNSVVWGVHGAHACSSYLRFGETSQDSGSSRHER